MKLLAHYGVGSGSIDFNKQMRLVELIWGCKEDAAAVATGQNKKKKKKNPTNPPAAAATVQSKKKKNQTEPPAAAATVQNKKKKNPTSTYMHLTHTLRTSSHLTHSHYLHQ